MSLVLVAALALAPNAHAAAAAHCSWDRPGVDPFMGNIPAAVDRYTDIPADVRQRLKARMAKRQYDEMATIRRDSITGRQRYSNDIRDMHFGQGRVCNTVSRQQWSAQTVERGLVYCEAEHCIIVPTVCRNVSRVTRLPGADAEAPGSDGRGPGTLLAGPGEPNGADVLPARMAGSPPSGDASELVFDPPGAGNSFAEAAQPLGALPTLEGGTLGAGSVPLASNLGPIPALAAAPAVVEGPGGGGGSSVPLGGSGLEVPVGVLPIGGGSVGGGGVTPETAPPVVPEIPDVPGIPGVPEPSGWLMWIAGVAGLMVFVRRKLR